MEYAGAQHMLNTVQYSAVEYRPVEYTVAGNTAAEYTVAEYTHVTSEYTAVQYSAGEYTPLEYTAAGYTAAEYTAEKFCLVSTQPMPLLPRRVAAPPPLRPLSTRTPGRASSLRPAPLCWPPLGPRLGARRRPAEEIAYGAVEAA